MGATLSRSLNFSASVLWIFGVPAPAARAAEHGCVYVNNNGNNRVSRFHLSPADGILQLLGTTATEEDGFTDGEVPIPRIAATAPVAAGGCLFVTNRNNFTAFRYALDDT